MNPWSGEVALVLDGRRHVAKLTLSGAVKVQRDLAARRDLILTRLPDLRGRDLACWCKPGCPCHADVLLELANA